MALLADALIVSSDSHVNEPRELYRERVPAGLRDKVEQEFLGPMQALKPTKQDGYNPRFPEEVERLKAEAAGGRWDPQARIPDQEMDAVDVDIMFPTAGLTVLIVDDPELRFALAHAYNDAIWDNFSAYSQRFIPEAIIPPEPTDMAVAEVQRVAKLGFKTIFLPSQSPGNSYNRPAHDPLWDVLEDLEMPVSFHIGTGHNPRVERGPGGAVINYALQAQGDGPMLTTYLCASGVLMKHPKLRFAIIESGASWVAWIMNAMDEAYVHHYMSVRDFERLDLLPSEYFKRQGHACFMYDPPALRNIAYTGADCLMWGNDYPHREATWPRSQQEIPEQFVGADVTEAQMRMLLGGNAARLYKLEAA
jgi:predicted TIM-barrel fold metal-dependent hydrolase